MFSASCSASCASSRTKVCELLVVDGDALALGERLEGDLLAQRVDGLGAQLAAHVVGLLPRLPQPGGQRDAAAGEAARRGSEAARRSCRRSSSSGRSTCDASAEGVQDLGAVRGLGLALRRR